MNRSGAVVLSFTAACFSLYVVIGMLAESEQQDRRSEQLVEQTNFTPSTGLGKPTEVTNTDDAENKAGGQQTTPNVEKYDRALELYEEARRLNAAGRFAEAAAVCSESVQLLRESVGDLPDTAVAINLLGSLQLKIGDRDSAERSFAESCRIFALLPEVDSMLVALPKFNLGSLYLARWQNNEASRLLSEALSDIRNSDTRNRTVEARVLNALGMLSGRTGNLQNSRQLLEDAVDIAGAALGNSNVEYANILHNLALTLIKLDEFVAAEHNLVRALEIHKSLHMVESTSYMTVLTSLGTLYTKQVRYERAEELLQEALNIGEKAIDETQIEWAGCLFQFGVLMRETERYERAEVFLERALSAIYECGAVGTSAHARMCTEYGILQVEMGHTDKAITLLDEAIRIHEQAHSTNDDSYHDAMHALASLYSERGDFETSERLVRRAITHVTATFGESGREYASVLNGLASLEWTMGDNQRATEHFRRAAEITAKIYGEEHPQYASALQNLGMTYFAVGDQFQAILQYELAKRIFEKTKGRNSHSYLTVVGNSGLSYLATGDFREAEASFLEAVNGLRTAVGNEHESYLTNLNNLGLLYEATRRHSEARDVFSRLTELRRRSIGPLHQHYASSLSNLGVACWLMEDSAQAESCLSEAAQIGVRILDLAASCQSERQQISLSRSLRPLLDGYLSFCAEAEVGANTIPQIVLRWKGLAFARQFWLRQGADRSEVRQALEELQTVVQRLSRSARSQQADTAQKLSLMVEQAERNLISLDAESRRIISADDVSNAIGPGAAFVDFLEYRYVDPARIKNSPQQCLLAVVYTANRTPQVVFLGPVQEIEASFTVWRQSYGMTEPGKVGGRKLRTLVWEPLLPFIRGMSTVIVSPDGVLCRIPFCALPGSEPNTFLLEEFELSVLPSAHLLVAGQEPRNFAEEVLVVGGVDFDATNDDPGLGASADEKRFRGLPGTLLEVDSVCQAWDKYVGQRNVVKLTGAKASEENVRSSLVRSSVVHLATHGYFSGDSNPQRRAIRSLENAESLFEFILESHDLTHPSVEEYHPQLESAVALAGANLALTNKGGHDGLLTAQEVSAMDLHRVALIVLSACETGLGSEEAGEGVLGLQRAFHVAGAGSVMASLWKVDDQATRVFMERFYENYWKRRMGKLQALREAQLWMLREGSGDGGVRGLVQLQEDKPVVGRRLSPYYWAAFVLSGDWR